MRAQSRRATPSTQQQQTRRKCISAVNGRTLLLQRMCLANDPIGIGASRLVGAAALSGLAMPSPPSRGASRPLVSIAGATSLRLFWWRGAADALCRSASHGRAGRGVRSRPRPHSRSAFGRCARQRLPATLPQPAPRRPCTLLLPLPRGCPFLRWRGRLRVRASAAGLAATGLERRRPLLRVGAASASG